MGSLTSLWPPVVVGWWVRKGGNGITSITYLFWVYFDYSTYSNHGGAFSLFVDWNAVLHINNIIDLQMEGVKCSPSYKYLSCAPSQILEINPCECNEEEKMKVVWKLFQFQSGFCIFYQPKYVDILFRGGRPKLAIKSALHPSSLEPVGWVGTSFSKVIKASRRSKQQ